MKTKKSMRSLAQDLKVIRRRPTSPQEIDQFNKIQDEDGKKKDKSLDRKIAKPQETTK